LIGVDLVDDEHHVGRIVAVTAVKALIGAVEDVVTQPVSLPIRVRARPVTALDLRGLAAISTVPVGLSALECSVTDTVALERRFDAGLTITGEHLSALARSLVQAVASVGLIEIAVERGVTDPVTLREVRDADLLVARGDVTRGALQRWGAVTCIELVVLAIELRVTLGVGHPIGGHALTAVTAHQLIVRALDPAVAAVEVELHAVERLIAFAVNTESLIDAGRVVACHHLTGRTKDVVDAVLGTILGGLIVTADVITAVGRHVTVPVVGLEVVTVQEGVAYGVAQQVGDQFRVLTQTVAVGDLTVLAGSLRTVFRTVLLVLARLTVAVATLWPVVLTCAFVEVEGFAVEDWVAGAVLQQGFDVVARDAGPVAVEDG
jgi:hypothetical protein